MPVVASIRRGNSGYADPTRPFDETVKARAERDPKCRAALLTEAIEQILACDADVGGSMLRDYFREAGR